MSEEAALPLWKPDTEDESTPRSGVEAARKQHEATLMSIEGVTGVGVGRTDIGDDAIVVYVMDASVARRVPKNRRLLSEDRSYRPY